MYFIKLKFLHANLEETPGPPFSSTHENLKFPDTAWFSSGRYSVNIGWINSNLPCRNAWCL